MAKLSRHLGHALEVPFSQLFIDYPSKFLIPASSSRPRLIQSFLAIPGTIPIPFTAHIDGPFTDGWLLLGHTFIAALYIAWDQFVIGDNTPPPPRPQSRHLPVRIRTLRRMLVYGRGGSICNTFKHIATSWIPRGESCEHNFHYSQALEVGQC